MSTLQAIATSIRNEIIRILQEDIVFDTQDTDIGGIIQPDAIIFQKTRAAFSREGQKSQQNVDMPGILISKPMGTRINPNEWEMAHDLWRRRFIVQIVDKDEFADTDRQDSWDKWEEQIISAFMFNCLPNATFDTQPTWLITTASGLQDIEERRWSRDGMLISDIEIEVRAAQGRGIIA